MPSHQSRTGLSVADALLWMFAVYLLLQAGLVVVGSAPQFQLLWAGVVQVAVLSLAIWAVQKRVGAFEGHRELLALRAASVRSLAAGAGLGLVLKLPAEYLRYLVELVFPTPQALQRAQAELLRHETGVQVTILFAVVAVFGPIVEEALYRGALFGGLRLRVGELKAGVITALGFVMMHAIADWLPLSLVALAFTVLRTSTGSLWPAVAAHIGFNGLSCVLITLDVSPFGPHQRMSPTTSTLLGASTLVSLAVLWGLYRSIRVERVKQSRANVEP